MLRFPRLGQKNPCKFCLSLLEHWLLRKPAATDKKSDFPEMSRPHGEERERLLHTIIQGLWLLRLWTCHLLGDLKVPAELSASS